MTSTVNGVEYLFGYLPIMADHDILGYFCASYPMTEVRGIIANNMRVIEWVNILIMVLAAAMLLFMTYFAVIKNLAFVQRTIREYRETKDSHAVKEKLDTIHSRNEVGDLANDFSDMAMELERYTDEMMHLSIQS